MLLHLLLVVCKAEIYGENYEIWDDFKLFYNKAGAYLYKNGNEFNKVNVITISKSLESKYAFINNLLGEQVVSIDDDIDSDKLNVFYRSNKLFNIYDVPKINDDLSNKDLVKNNVIDTIDKFEKTNDETKQIRFAYYLIDCVNDNFDEKDVEFINQFLSDPHFKKTKLIIVLANSYIQNIKNKIMNLLQMPDESVVPLLSYPVIYQECYMKPYGLEELKDEMIKSLPKSLYNCYDEFMWQKIKSKNKWAALTIGLGTVASTCCTFIPYKFAKYAFLGASEVLMLYSIKRIYEIDFHVNFSFGIINDNGQISLKSIKETIDNGESIVYAMGGLGLLLFTSNGTSTNSKESFTNSKESFTNSKKSSSNSKKTGKFNFGYLFTPKKVFFGTLGLGCGVSYYGYNQYKKTIISEVAFNEYINTLKESVLVKE